MSSIPRLIGKLAPSFGLGCLTMLEPGSATAEVQLFQVDPVRSSLTLQGQTAGVAWQEQAAGSLVAQFQGWLAVDLNTDSIQFIAGSSLVGIQTNVWSPGPRGSGAIEPADFGGNVTVGTGFSTVHMVSAIRDLAFSVSSDPLPLVDGEFMDALQLTTPTGGPPALDYRASSLLVQGGRRSLAGLGNANVPGPGTFVKPINPDSGPVLTIPIDVSLPAQATPAGDTILRFTGQVVATRGGFILQPVLLWVPSATVAGQFTLVWDARFKLQSTPDLGTPNWTDYPATAPVDVSFDGEAGFFRLVPAP